jgi:predicted RNase H-like nuclease (RuvC/YqgF family)
VEKLAGMLKDGSHLSDDDAVSKANALIKKQNKFYQDAIDLYFTRNHEILSKLDNRLEDLLDQHQELLKVTTSDNSNVDPEAMGKLSNDIAALSKELEELRAENASLSTQLKAAEHELDQLGREYVSAFNKPKVSKAKGDGEAAGSDEIEQSETNANGQTTDEHEPDAVRTAHADDKMAASEAGKDAQTTPAAPPLKTEKPEASSRQIAGNAVPKPESDALYIDELGDQNMLADLGLSELIGEQPGQPVGSGKK